MAVPSMEPMAEEYAGRGVQFLFVYVREAHPGEHYPHHDNLERKLAHARAFQQQFNVRRPILVDDLQGTAHRAYGGLPNMTYIVSRANQVVFKSDWTDPPTIRWAVDYLLGVQDLRRRGGRVAPFYAELQGYRWSDPAGFQTGLERDGPKAVREFAEAQARWARGEHLGSLER